VAHVEGAEPGAPAVQVEGSGQIEVLGK